MRLGLNTGEIFSGPVNKEETKERQGYVLCRQESPLTNRVMADKGIKHLNFNEIIVSENLSFWHQEKVFFFFNSGLFL